MYTKDFFLKKILIKDKKIINLLHKSIAISLAISLIGALIIEVNSFFYDASIIIIRTGLFMLVTSIISAIVIGNFKENN